MYFSLEDRGGGRFGPVDPGIEAPIELRSGGEFGDVSSPKPDEVLAAMCS
jgi:hypothetical protein